MILTLENLHMHATEEEGCLLWSHSVNSKGYPQACLDGKTGQMVRRYVYACLCGKPLHKGYVVTSRCRRALCITPECLVGKSRGQLMLQEYRDGVRGTRACYEGRVAALVKQGRTKLSLEIARQMRNSEESEADLARLHGVHRRTVNKILNGQAWRDPITSASVFTWRP